MSYANKLKTVLKSVNNLYGMAFNLVHILTMSVLPQTAASHNELGYNVFFLLMSSITQKWLHLT